MGEMMTRRVDGGRGYTKAAWIRGYYTLAEWKAMPPYRKGFVLYMEGAHPGSPLRGQSCPYHEGTEDYAEYQEGQRRAAMLAQDSEE
jgi:hypothetical protein